MALSFELTESEKEFLANQARLGIESVFSGREQRPLDPSAGDKVLERDLGSFVTLTIGGQLRGCIGTIVGREPLYRNVWSMARAAAFQDPRFPPLTEVEWAKADMEISVLDQPASCPDWHDIVIGRDGLILQCEGRSGVFLPQVPVEQRWDLRQYLDHLCLKAGVAPGAWKKPEARLYWFQALVFKAGKGGR